MTAFFSKKINRHIIGWSAFVFCELSLYFLAGLGSNHQFLDYIVAYILYISLFYFNVYVVLRYINKTGKPWYTAVLLVLLELGIYWMILLVSKHWMHITLRPSEPYVLSSVMLYGSLWRCIYFLMLSVTYWLVLNIIEKNKRINQLELARIKAKKTKAELKNAYLMTQLNPYLLFNTLDFVYNAVKRAPDAARSVTLLTDIMTHALRRTGKDGKIALSEEVDHIRKLTELCCLRYNNEAYINLITEGESSGKRIPPLVLVTFIENVIKHGDLSDPEHPAQIMLQVRDTGVCLSTKNLKKNTDIGISHQIGIRNAQLRMAELYPKKAVKLSIEEDPDFYKVNLYLSI